VNPAFMLYTSDWDATLRFTALGFTHRLVRD